VASVCVKCGKQVGLIGSVSFNRQTGHCAACEKLLQQAYLRFQQAFQSFCADGMLTEYEWNGLVAGSQQDGLNLRDSLAFVHNDALKFLNQRLTQALASGRITEQVEATIRQFQELFMMPDAAARPVLDRINQAKAEQHQHDLNRFRQAFLVATSIGVFTDQSWQTLVAGVFADGLDLREALAYVRGDALHLLEQTLAFAASDGTISSEESAALLQLQRQLEVPDAVAQSVLERLVYLQEITAIREGKLPAVATDVYLDSGESCHLDVTASYHKVGTRNIVRVVGRFVATDRKLHFLSDEGGFEIDWKKVKRVERQPGRVYLQLSVKKGNGTYSVADPLRVEATFDTLVKMSNRQQFASYDDDEVSRHIPKDVKQAVWQRDRGKCMECGASGRGAWLEFDHIIPHSKGGANTIGNVQLLCRGCNLAKGDRI